MRQQSIYNMNPRRINELIDEVLAEIEAEGGMQDAIRKEKASLIDNIMRGYKMAQIYHAKSREYMADPIGTFDRLYDKDLDVLEALSKALDKHNTAYMQEQMRKNNRASWNIDGSEWDVRR